MEAWKTEICVGALQMMLSHLLRTNLDCRMDICQGREVYH